MEKFLEANQKLVYLLFSSFILVGVGVALAKGGFFEPATKVEILEGSGGAKADLVVEIAGEVIRPGVYKLPAGSRVEDLLIAAGGLAAGADRENIEKYLNRAAKLTDGQKVYVPSIAESNNSQSNAVSAKKSDYINSDQGILGVNQSGLVNINSASLTELDKLPGIGPVYGQSIIEHRPYSTPEELVTKGALKQSVYEKIKDKITVY